MDTITLLLAALFSVMVTTSNPEMPQEHNATTEQTVASNDCGENCQLPSKPDDDEDED